MGRGRLPKHPLGLGGYAPQELVQAIARQEFVQALEEVNNGELLRGLKRLLPLAEAFARNGGVFAWPLPPQGIGEALARGIVELYAGMGLTPKRVPSPWLYQATLETLRQAVVTGSGEVGLPTFPAPVPLGTSKPLHPALPGLVYNPALSVTLTVHDGFSVEQHLLTQREVEERLFHAAHQAMEAFRASLALLKVLEKTPGVESLVTPAVRGAWRLLRSCAPVLDGAYGELGIKSKLRKAVRYYIEVQESSVSETLRRVDSIPPEVFRWLARAYRGEPAKVFARGVPPAVVSRQLHRLAELLPLSPPSRTKRA